MDTCPRWDRRPEQMASRGNPRPIRTIPWQRLTTLGCDIHTHAPAKKGSTTSCILYPFVLRTGCANPLGHGHGYACHSPYNQFATTPGQAVGRARAPLARRPPPGASVLSNNAGHAMLRSLSCRASYIAYCVLIFKCRTCNV